MHSKQTVRYLCECYPSGNRYYYKQEIITYDSWDQPDSLEWGTKRPITEKTFRLREKEGYRCKIVYINRSPAVILPFPQQ